MTSTERVKRKPQSEFFELIRPQWDDSQPNENTTWTHHYYEALGLAVATFNDLEFCFRELVGAIAGLQDRTSGALLTHVSTVTLTDAIRSLADISQDADVSDELQFCGKLFDANRINRNFVAHSSTFKLITIDGEDKHLFTKRSSKGKLKVEQWLIPLNSVRQCVEEVIDAKEFLMCVHGPLVNADFVRELSLPYRPSVPRQLATSSLKLAPGEPPFSFRG